MALSGSYDFSQNRDDMIKDALTTAKVVREDETPTGSMINSASRLLNRMIKAWTVHGLQLWSYRDCLLFLESNKERYQLSSTGDRWIVKQDAAETQLNGALAVSATAVTVDSTAGMTAADVIGIVTASNTMHWDTIASVDTTTTLTLTTGVAAAAADNAYVVAYTSKAQKPYRITEAKAVPYSNTDSNQRPVNIISINEWYTRNNDYSSTDAPVEIKFIPQRTEGIVHVRNVPTVDNHHLILSAQMPVDDMDSAANDFYFPDYWYEAIHYNLAYRLYIDYGIKMDNDPYHNHAKELEKLAENALTEAKDYDVEDTYIQLEPDEVLNYGSGRP